MRKLIFVSLITLTYSSLLAQTDTIPGEAEYRTHYDCRYEPGNILIVQKKGKDLNCKTSFKLSDDGFVIRMEAIYDLEFSDGKRFKSGVIKNITEDSLTISSTMSEKCAVYEGIKYELFKYPINSIKTARFISDRSLGDIVINSFVQLKAKQKHIPTDQFCTNKPIVSRGSIWIGAKGSFCFGQYGQTDLAKGAF